MRAEEILQAANGLDEEMFARAFMKIETRLIPAEAGSEEADPEIGETIDTQVLDGPCLRITRGYVFTTVDILFDEEDEEAFRETERILRECTIREGAFSINPIEKPAIILTVVPKEYVGEYYICGIYGGWGLMTKTTGDVPDTIRLLFTNELFHVFRINEEHVAEVLTEDTP